MEVDSLIALDLDSCTLGLHTRQGLTHRSAPGDFGLNVRCLTLEVMTEIDCFGVRHDHNHNHNHNHHHYPPPSPPPHLCPQRVDLPQHILRPSSHFAQRRRLLLHPLTESIPLGREL
jgi:hypothetical protein